jgi:hypothetical protein
LASRSRSKSAWSIFAMSFVTVTETSLNLPLTLGVMVVRPACTCQFTTRADNGANARPRRAGQIKGDFYLTVCHLCFCRQHFPHYLGARNCERNSMGDSKISHSFSVTLIAAATMGKRWIPESNTVTLRGESCFPRMCLRRSNSASVGVTISTPFNRRGSSK